MYKIITCIFIVTALIHINAADVHAEEFEAQASASLKAKSEQNGFDYRVINLRNFLSKFNSPLTDFAEDFVLYADQYGLDYRLVPAIAGVESTFGKRIPMNSYNAYGWANGKYKFTSWEHSIGVVSMTLRTKYIDCGAGTVSKIARRYAPPSTTWGSKVKHFVKRIDNLPLTFDI